MIPGKLGIEELDFQVLRRTVATQAQREWVRSKTSGNISSSRGLDTTAKGNMQARPAYVQERVGLVYQTLTKGGRVRGVI